jgi:hypothetical protein
LLSVSTPSNVQNFLQLNVDFLFSSKNPKNQLEIKIVSKKLAKSNFLNRPSDSWRPQSGFTSGAIAAIARLKLKSERPVQGVASLAEKPRKSDEIIISKRESLNWGW